MGWVHNASQAVDEQSQWPTILGVCLALTFIMVTTVGLRAYVRVIMLKTVGADDWVILFSMMCSIVYSGLAVGQTKWGLGLDLPLRPKVNADNYAVASINFAGRPFYMAGITGFKVALCISYIRVLRQTKNRLYRQVVWFVMISCTVLHLAGTLVLIFQCNPVKKSWRPQTPGTCLANAPTFYALAAVTIFYDCIIFLLPIPFLTKLQINTRRKVALIGVFGFGLFTTVCSVLRLVQIPTIAKTGNSTMLVLWGTIEMNVGIALTCLPTLAPLFNYYREKTTRSTRGYVNSEARKVRQSYPLGGLKSTKTQITTSSSEKGRRDLESSENSSQKGIVDGEEDAPNHYPNYTSESYNGIMATTRVEVRVSDVHEDENDQFYNGARLHGV